MRATLITIGVKLLIKLLTPEVVTDGLKSFRDYIEEKVKESDTKIDDIIILPILDMLESEEVKITIVPAIVGFAEEKIKENDIIEDDLLLPLIDSVEAIIKK